MNELLPQRIWGDVRQRSSLPQRPNQISNHRNIQNIDSDNESNSKTVTRFPPIKGKSEETPNAKENAKEIATAVPLAKKVSEDNNHNAFKKQNHNIRKRVDKKKGKGVEIKPEIQEKYKMYMDFIGLVNLTNNLRVQVTEHLPSYVLYVGKGNNSSLIKNLFKTHRPWWTIEENNPDNPNINLHWFQLRQNSILDNFK